ncbi:hypothetical protein V8G54_028273 [Vigna mungo]|uniref:PB1-like domain-containing protein n=1 Tax=Vigna mungo TaxID=3915 RepID=A0AAQ3MRN7_VIGMU
MEGDIEVVIHHGGKLVNEGYLKYEGECDTMYFDPDLWSYFVVVSVVKALGYAGFEDLWYFVGCGPKLDDKLEALSDDVKWSGALYVVHSVSQPDVIEMIEYNVDEEVEEVNPEMHDGGECAELDDGGVIAQFGDGTEQLDEGVGGDVDEGDKIEVDVVEGDGIEVDVAEGDEIEGDVGEGEGIQHDEAHDEETIQVHVEGERKQHDEADGEERIEVHVDGEGIEHVQGHAEETIEAYVQSDGKQDDDSHDQERIEVDVDGEGIEHVEVHAEETIQADVEAKRTEVNEWSSSDDDICEVNVMDGEVNSVDGLVNINIQSDFRERDSCGNMEVDCIVLSESDVEEHESDLEEHDISDSSLFNDEWESKELSSPDISDEESDVEEGYGNFVTFTMSKKMVDFK